MSEKSFIITNLKCKTDEIPQLKINRPVELYCIYNINYITILYNIILYNNVI